MVTNKGIIPNIKARTFATIGIKHTDKQRTSAILDTRDA